MGSTIVDEFDLQPVPNGAAGCDLAELEGYVCPFGNEWAAKPLKRGIFGIKNDFLHEINCLMR
jgi:hypothetical protein